MNTILSEQILNRGDDGDTANCILFTIIMTNIACVSFKKYFLIYLTVTQYYWMNTVLII